MKYLNETQATLAIRAIWRDELLAQLSDPAQRVFWLAIADPSPRNLEQAVTQLTADDLKFLLRGLTLLNALVANDTVATDDPIYAALEEMSDKLAHLHLPAPAAPPSDVTPRAAPVLGLGDAIDDARRSPEITNDHQPPAIADQPVSERTPQAEVKLNEQTDVAARNIYLGNSITVSGDFLPSRASDALVTSLDVSDAVETAQLSFVRPPHFAELVRLLREHRMVLLTGRGCGNFAAASAALHQMHRRPILELPGGIPTQTLISTIERICRQDPSTGILVESVDAEMLRALTGFEFRRLQRALTTTASLVLTTAIPKDVLVSPSELRTLDGSPPDPEQVIRSLVRVRGLSRQSLALALRALELLPQPVSPRAAIALVTGASSRPTDTRSGIHSLEQLVQLAREQAGMQPSERQDGPGARVHVTDASRVRVFLCHASDDKPAVRRLDRRLRGDGIPTWLDERELLPGQEWDPTIRAAVRAADIVIVCLSRLCHQSGVSPAGDQACPGCGRRAAGRLLLLDTSEARRM